MLPVMIDWYPRLRRRGRPGYSRCAPPRDYGGEGGQGTADARLGETMEKREARLQQMRASERLWRRGRPGYSRCVPRRDYGREGGQATADVIDWCVIDWHARLPKRGKPGYIAHARSTIFC